MINYSGNGNKILLVMSADDFKQYWNTEKLYLELEFSVIDPVLSLETKKAYNLHNCFMPSSEYIEAEWETLISIRHRYLISPFCGITFTL